MKVHLVGGPNCGPIATTNEVLPGAMAPSGTSNCGHSYNLAVISYVARVAVPLGHNEHWYLVTMNSATLHHKHDRYRTRIRSPTDYMGICCLKQF